ncbi:protein MpPOD20 [Marchantia polymorpha subsp. ruderalis]|uniref:Plant heme peroxidase family profile domain-containing protein n=1 Tax=Marchantia polymorpha TaxID=3197 RepID=A0A2R6VZK0_MARPO|nr:hypothetical protein MARPO_0245s0004 [Marchantia polymorpha]BBN03631.1 hypothetical protein Mp_2g25010 [Marchantia polymorpha subsp. ruderalis]|eukprot:PTQ27002.1 hypothetical protein MARPO_0245s0004 [Marchantia polymorpha]
MIGLQILQARFLFWDQLLQDPYCSSNGAPIASSATSCVPGPRAFLSSSPSSETRNSRSNQRLHCEDSRVVIGINSTVPIRWHSIGRAKCGAFSHRIYGFSGLGQSMGQINGTDPTLDPEYAKVLRQQCPQHAHLNTVFLDPSGCFSGQTSKYPSEAVKDKRGVLPSDAAKFGQMCQEYPRSENLKYVYICTKSITKIANNIQVTKVSNPYPFHL